VIDIVAVIDGLDLVVSLAEGQVHPEELDRARSGARAVREARGHLGATLVLALVGGTGSGKSSLLNALAGEVVASVSPMRPHTTRPLAWVPSDAEPGLYGLLDRFGVEERVVHDRFPGLALLDMTDVDSVATGHLANVEALLPAVDGIVWVLDPEKYHDPGLHNRLIAPLSDSGDQFVFVLNQVDRLADEDVLPVLDDLRATLQGEGIGSPAIFATAADPMVGEPMGITALADHLKHRLDAKRMYLGRAIADARRAARDLADAAGIRRGATLDFEERWKLVVGEVVAGVGGAGIGPGDVEDAIGAVEDLVGRLAAEAGGLFGARLRCAMSSELVEGVVRDAVVRSAEARPRPRGLLATRSPGLGRRIAAEFVSGELEQRIGDPLRELLWERARLGATVAGLAVEALQAEAVLRRGGAAAKVQ
jgi:energy-coupling factor transporter ATP-binding protein EcfA2